MPNYEPAKITERALDSEGLAILIRAAIDRGHSISFDAPGGSMRPFIRSGDKIFISRIEEKSIRSGNVLAFVRPHDGRVIAHRVVKIENGRFLCKGDDVETQNDGWIGFEDVLGQIERVEREGEPIRLGVVMGKRMVAWLSGRNWLVPMISTLRKIKWGFLGLFSPKSKIQS